MARLHEYQGKELLKQFRIPIPRGGVARTPEEARQIAEDVGGEVMVITNKGSSALGLANLFRGKLL